MTVGFRNFTTLKLLKLSWATAKTITMIAYGANARTTSAAESRSAGRFSRTKAGSSTAPPATGTGSGRPVSNCSSSRGFQTRVSSSTAATEMTDAAMSHSL